MDVLEVILKLFLAIALGGIIGLEREASRKPAGFRTNILVCITSTMMMVMASSLIKSGGGSGDAIIRMAAGMMTGIGFIGAGTILQARGAVAGLTTASTIWLVSSLGLLIGAGYYLYALIFTVLTMATLILFLRVEESFLRKSQFNCRLKISDRLDLISGLRKLAMHHGIKLEKFTVKKEQSLLVVNFSFSSTENKEKEFTEALLALGGIEELSLE